ncbi:putative secreted protein with PEP-CTERM sorting signal [Pseudoduganella flava]|uniref:Putative secreted protein with PEP-CTERM sorting signal n=1 Tax=Pseudoduganella flava TaxID=871742 RepID=A0A562Q4N9_9BURK|nr:hypothetical protein [Pseudoduganella flava]QGZ41697.1 hypothetical protein GO485_23325 [Pseudoduganella flava]TWI51692.1 putative secreted protein with PEP-CTERM sorting signal [Pseudoduganella flava]
MLKTLPAALLLALSSATQAANVGIGWSWHYDGTLAATLTARGDTVSLYERYDAGALAGLDVFIQDGNARADAAALDAFVFNGGTLIQVPWSFTQTSFTAATSVFGPRRGFQVGESLTAISALDAESWLLRGVQLPEEGAGIVSRERGNAFLDGATPVLAWDDGSALLGYRQYGAGTIVALNVNLLTADSYPLAAAWSNQIVYNAVDAAISAVPEPAPYATLAVGLLALGGVARRRHQALG